MTTSFQELFQIQQRVEVRINVTNACNLHCDFCDHAAHLPFSSAGTKLHRRKPIVAAPEALERFCQALAGIGEDERHVLQGGEITVLPVPLIVRFIDTLHAAGRHVGMRTNGYNLTGIPMSSLNKLRFIYLDAHGNNREAVAHCQAFLRDHYAGSVVLEEHFQHRDPSQYLHHNQGSVAQGLNCSHLLATLTFLPPTVHPCCNSWALMNALNTTTMSEALHEAGWTSDNPDLKDTLARWRTTLPRRFLEEFCASSCYLTATDTPDRLYEIRPHARDKVLKATAKSAT